MLSVAVAHPSSSRSRVVGRRRRSVVLRSFLLLQSRSSTCGRSHAFVRSLLREGPWISRPDERRAWPLPRSPQFVSEQVRTLDGRLPAGGESQVSCPACPAFVFARAFAAAPMASLLMSDGGSELRHHRRRHRGRFARARVARRRRIQRRFRHVLAALCALASLPTGPWCRANRDGRGLHRRARRGSNAELFCGVVAKGLAWGCERFVAPSGGYCRSRLHSSCGSAAGCAGGPSAGSMTRNSLPWPGVLSSSMWPPRVWTARRTIASPRPEPPVARSRVLSTR